jgi:hypothetical protein
MDKCWSHWLLVGRFVMAISTKTGATCCANCCGRDKGPYSSLGNQRKGQKELPRWVSHDASVALCCYVMVYMIYAMNVLSLVGDWGQGARMLPASADRMVSLYLVLPYTISVLCTRVLSTSVLKYYYGSVIF